MAGTFFKNDIFIIFGQNIAQNFSFDPCLGFLALILAYLRSSYWKAAKIAIIRSFGHFLKKMAWKCKKIVKIDCLDQKSIDFGARVEKFAKSPFWAILGQIWPFLVSAKKSRTVGPKIIFFAKIHFFTLQT